MLTAIEIGLRVTAVKGYDVIVQCDGTLRSRNAGMTAVTQESKPGPLNSRIPERGHEP